MIDMIARDWGGRQPVELRIALVTARGALELDEDMPLLLAALRAEGVEVETPYWDDPHIDWSRFGSVLLRSTWDYAERIEEFLAWCDRCAARTRLMNPPDVIRWNTDKHYLVDLARAGVPVVPSRFVEPGSDARADLEAFLAGGASSLTIGVPCGFEEFVVKPAIGAGSRDAARYGRSDAAPAVEHVHRLQAAGRSVLLQPYLAKVDEHGETAVLYLGGRFSHAVRKGPLLRPGAAMVEGLFAPEEIRPRDADRAELGIAASTYSAIPFAAPAYARIDLLRDAWGAPVVLELELTEPSLFLAHAPGAAGPFARHLAQHLREASASASASASAEVRRSRGAVRVAGSVPMPLSPPAPLRSARLDTWRYLPWPGSCCCITGCTGRLARSASVCSPSCRRSVTGRTSCRCWTVARTRPTSTRS